MWRPRWRIAWGASSRDWRPTGTGGHEPAQAGDPAELKRFVEQLSRYLAESDADGIECFEAAAPHLRMLFDPDTFQRFASLIESYAFSEAYEALMAVGDGSEGRIVMKPE